MTERTSSIVNEAVSKIMHRVKASDWQKEKNKTLYEVKLFETTKMNLKSFQMRSSIMQKEFLSLNKLQDHAYKNPSRLNGKSKKTLISLSSNSPWHFIIF